jgi:nicotinate dehydrogenase subunit B
MISNQLPESLQENPNLDQWIGFEAGGKVRLMSGKVEIGQGINTAIIQIAADELDVAPQQIRLISGRTGGVAPNEGYTAGSRSIESGGQSVRLVAAEVRRLFLEKAAFKLGCKISDLSMVEGRILKGGTDTGLDYWTLTGEVDLSRAATGTAPLKAKADRRLIGKSLPRTDLPGKVFGTNAPFIHDLSPEGMLHARVLRQPWPGAQLAALDEAAAVRATGGKVEVWRSGNYVAVLCEDETMAVKAMETVARFAKWQGGAPLSPEMASADHLAKQPSKDRVIEAGKPVAAAKAVRKVEATYSKPYIAHASIGVSCALARLDGDKLTVWSHTQGVYPLLAALSKALPHPADKISIIHHHGSGCYGHNPADDVAYDAARIAKQFPGRPVRVLWSREDELACDPFQTAQQVSVSAEIDSQGRPQNWTVDLWSGTHGRRPMMGGNPHLIGAFAQPNPPPLPELMDVPDSGGGGGVRNSALLYDFPQKINHHFVPGTPVRTSSFRGLGAFANVFALESFMDELAEAAGQDPVKYRLSLMSDPRSRAVIEAVAAMSGWREDMPAGTGKGRGCAFARYKNRAGYLALVTEVEVDEQVNVTKIWGAVDCGLVVNPDGLLNQVEGGIVYALSCALKERVRFEDGRVVSTSWETYPILKFSEVPEIELKLIDRPDDPPLGAGEVSHGPVAASLANAVAHALGVRIRELPLDRETLVAALSAE